MSRLTSNYPERVYSSGEEKQRSKLAGRERVPLPGLLLAGLAVLGLGAFAWYYLGPDLQRYLKIRRM
ncbi:MAG TPA: hypothetical protein VMF69_19110 [Gemmataceae bacterium]|nr:hypothetical protein [Gemmataceae bacterium]